MLSRRVIHDGKIVKLTANSTGLTFKRWKKEEHLKFKDITGVIFSGFKIIIFANKKSYRFKWDLGNVFFVYFRLVGKAIQSPHYRSITKGRMKDWLLLFRAQKISLHSSLSVYVDVGIEYLKTIFMGIIAIFGVGYSVLDLAQGGNVVIATTILIISTIAAWFAYESYGRSQKLLGTLDYLQHKVSFKRH